MWASGTSLVSPLSVQTPAFLSPYSLVCVIQGQTLQDIHYATVDTSTLQINALKYQQTRAVRRRVGGRHTSRARGEMRLEGGRGWWRSDGWRREQEKLRERVKSAVWESAWESRHPLQCQALGQTGIYTPTHGCLDCPSDRHTQALTGSWNGHAHSGQYSATHLTHTLTPLATLPSPHPLHFAPLA